MEKPTAPQGKDSLPQPAWQLAVAMGLGASGREKEVLLKDQAGPGAGGRDVCKEAQEKSDSRGLKTSPLQRGVVRRAQSQAQLGLQDVGPHVEGAGV